MSAIGSGGPPSAVLWDFGGVITTSPFEAFARYEEERGLPAGFLRSVNATNPHANAWARFERGEVDLETFGRAFEEEAEAAGGSLDALELVALLSAANQVRPAMVEAVRRCHQRMKTALLTNNFLVDGRTVDYSLAFGGGPPGSAATVSELFDLVVESSRVGVRKPDPRFYTAACEELGVAPGDAVFLDDLGVNLKPARALGMTTIKVTDPESALDELEGVVGFPLR